MYITEETRKTTEEKGRTPGFAINAGIGGLIAFIVSVILLFLCAVLISSGKIGEAMRDNAVMVSTFIGSSAGAVVGAKRYGKSVMPVGSCSGAVFLAILLLLTALGGEGASFGVMTIKLGICCIVGGLFGGVLCLGRKKQKRKRRSTRRG